MTEWARKIAMEFRKRRVAGQAKVEAIVAKPFPVVAKFMDGQTVRAGAFDIPRDVPMQPAVLAHLIKAYVGPIYNVYWKEDREDVVEWQEIESTFNRSTEPARATRGDRTLYPCQVDYRDETNATRREFVYLPENPTRDQVNASLEVAGRPKVSNYANEPSVTRLHASKAVQTSVGNAVEPLKPAELAELVRRLMQAPGWARRLLNDEPLFKGTKEMASSVGGISFPTLQDVRSSEIDAYLVDHPAASRMTARQVLFQSLYEKAARGEAWR